MRLPFLSTPFTNPQHGAALVMFGAMWLLMLVLALTEPAGGTNGAGTALAQLACLCMLIHCEGQKEALRDAASRFENRCAPSAAWTACVRGSLRSLSLGWLLLLCGTTLYFVLPGRAAHGLAAGALLSLAACLGTASALRRTALLPGGAWANRCATAALLAIVAAQFLPGSGSRSDWLAALPPAVLLSLLLAWPVMAALLARRWRSQPASRGAAAVGQRSSDLHLWRHLQRYTMLNEGMPQRDGSMKPLGAGARLLLLALVPVFTVMYLRASWGMQLNGLHLQGLVIVATVGSASLLMRDLHWRRLLAPRGPRTRGIALNIYFSTLTLQLVPTAMLGASVALLDCMVAREPLAAALQKMWMHTLAVPELAFSLALAVLIRSWGKWAIVGCGMGAMSLGLALIWFDEPLKLLQLTAGPLYAAALLLGTCAALLLAKRVWTPEKLQPYFRQS